MRASITVLASVLGFFLLSFPGYGQIDTGTISGLIRDSGGAVIPDAKVNIASEATGQKIELLSNESGLFLSGPLRPGSYVVEVEAKGFSKSAKRIPLEVNERASLTFVSRGRSRNRKPSPFRPRSPSCRRKPRLCPMSAPSEP